MHADSLVVAALLLGTAVFVIGSLTIFATTLLDEVAPVGTLVVLLVAVAAASVLGVLSEKKPRTPYW